MTRSVKEWMEDTREFPRHLPDDPDTPYLSPSQVRTLFTCGAQYKYKYLEGRPYSMNMAAWFGIACHDGLCKGFTQWVETGIPPTPDLVMDAAEEKLDEFLTELGPEKISDHHELDDERKAAELEEVRTISRVLLTWFIDNGFRPLAAEVEVSKRFRDFATYGFADVVALDSQDRLWVLDFKTTGATPPHGQARRIHAFQLIVYASAIEAEGIEGIDLNPIHGTAAVYGVRNKTPKVVFAPVPFHEGTKSYAASMAHNAGDQIQFGNLSPNPVAAGWKCHPERCSYWDICPGKPGHEDNTPDDDMTSGIQKEVTY